ncbi:MAG TPA: ethylbenzene dehydrogenase-related protein [Dehalococcoidia bacterium]|nr:ethylbenzene dehydrogenase-related protein [Dehalococcoidia bacterium]
MVTAVRVSASGDGLLDPDGATWRGAPGSGRGIAVERIKLMPTPLALQPSEYVQAKWKALRHGDTPEVRVAAAHNGQAIFFHLEWDDASDDSHPNDMADFPDQGGVMLPVKQDAVIEEMGDASKPVNMWLWRGDIDPPFYVTAMGRGTTIRHPDSPLSGRGTWRNGVWSVVIGRPFNVSLPAQFVVPLAPGMTHKCTFAIWQGSNKERAGLKAYGPVWQPLVIAP